MKIKYIMAAIAAVFYQCSAPEEKVSNYSRDSSDVKVELTKEKAKQFYEQKEYDSVVKFYTILIANDSNNGEYYFKRGFAYGQLLKQQMSIGDFEKSIKLHFKNATCFYNIGLNYAGDDDSTALKYFKKCIAADPRFTDAYIEIESCEKRLKLKTER